MNFFTLIIMKTIPQFSFFLAPITRNLEAHTTVTLNRVYKGIREPHYKEITEQLRAKPTKRERTKFKAQNFNYVTFAGTFTKRGEKYLVKESGLLVLDFDDLPDVEAVKQQLLHDEYFETQLLFRSPSGTGLKWVIEKINQWNLPHDEYFEAVANCIFKNHGLKVDSTGKDIARACFISHDPDCFIHEKYLNENENL